MAPSLKKQCILALLFMLIAAPAFAGKMRVSGYPLVEDGDTLQFDDKRVRLLCIDAPESNQSFGSDATAAMMRMVKNKKVICTGYFFDKYKRLLAKCRTQDDLLNAQMAAQGLAVASGGKACRLPKKLGDEAKQKNLGLWADKNFIAPHTWRKLHPQKHQPVGKKPI